MQVVTETLCPKPLSPQTNQPHQSTQTDYPNYQRKVSSVWMESLPNNGKNPRISGDFRISEDFRISGNF
jgi:hypothetical protein